MGRVATIDTSVLLSLQCTNTLAAISVLFDRILVPETVRREVAAGGIRNQLVARAMAEFAFFKPCDDYDPVSVRLLLDTRKDLRRGEDQGEAEAVAQAAKTSADMALIDDRFGRKCAARHDIECHGTLWIFDQLRTQGYLVNLRPNFEQLIRSNRRQPRGLMNRLLSKFEESEISTEEHRSLGEMAR